EVPSIDSSYYAVHHARVHVPVTDPTVMFFCGEASVHMAAGEAWTFDPSKPHKVMNLHPTPSVHLVVDTVPSPEFWEASAGPVPALQFESHNFPVVMSPAEQESLVELLDDVPAVVLWFLHDWRELWHQHGESPSGWAQYRALLDLFDRSLESLPERETVR